MGESSVQPRVRRLDTPPVTDGVWSDLLDDVRRWHVDGAPASAIVAMIDADWGVTFTEDIVRSILVGFRENR